MIAKSTRKAGQTCLAGKAESVTGRPSRPTQMIALAMAATISGLAATPSMADDKGITRFSVKNCTPAKILVCAYDKADNALLIPYHARRLQPKETEKFSCGSAEKCKVFMGTDVDGYKKVMSTTTGQAVTGTAAGVAGTAGVAVGSGTVATIFVAAAGVGLTGAIGITAGATVVVAGAAVGTVFGVVKTIDGFAAGDMCKKMMKETKENIDKIDDKDLRQVARDSRKVRIDGNWPGYKSYRVVDQNGAMVFERGDDCAN